MNYRIINQISRWKQAHKVIVLATGVFDLLHQEHLNFLNKAKLAGDKLIVGLETDARVKIIKGKDRPINPQTIRLKKLQDLSYVDIAFLLPEKFDTQTAWEKLISDLKPNIYAVSSHSSHLENKRAICEKYGTILKIVHQHNPTISTTIILKT